ncbi:MAG: DUF1326 domain-containing protein [Chthoniobacterales bacterium]
MIRGAEFANCNCAWGCPCQFSSPSTHGHCEAMGAGRIEEGYFNETRLDGLNFVMILQWPGEIAEGNGRGQIIIDERADEAQRAALRKILNGESTAPGTTHFNIFNSTLSEVLDPIYAPIELKIDVDAREASVKVPNLVESEGVPMTNPFTGEPARARIELPNCFEYTKAEIGSGKTKVTTAIQLDLEGSYGQFNILHMNQDGVIR